MDHAQHRYRTFREFYPFYLTEHTNPTSRRLHIVGTTMSIFLLIAAMVATDWRLAVAALLVGYGFAWAGHFFFEKNKPATFRYPAFSLMGDFRLWYETVTGRRRW